MRVSSSEEMIERSVTKQHPKIESFIETYVNSENRQKSSKPNGHRIEGDSG